MNAARCKSFPKAVGAGISAVLNDNDATAAPATFFPFFFPRMFLLGGKRESGEKFF